MVWSDIVLQAETTSGIHMVRVYYIGGIHMVRGILYRRYSYGKGYTISDAFIW